VDEYVSQGLSRADVWMLSGLVASEVALPQQFRNEIDFPLEWFGRRTCEEDNGSNCGTNFLGEPAECTEFGGPHRDLCHGGSGTQTIRQFFQDEFGFNDRQIVAIMGAHSVGRMRRENVGNVGQWDLTRNTLDNGYFLELTTAAPDFELTFLDNSDFGVADAFQWEGTVDGGTTITMLNSDLALVRDLGDADTVTCDWSGSNACSDNTPFADDVQNYVFNTGAFLSDYRDVLNLMIDFGHTKTDCSPSQQGICRFS
jgi:hypothetical protein